MKVEFFCSGFRGLSFFSVFFLGFLGLVKGFLCENLSLIQLTN